MAYRVVSGVMLASGDPVGDVEAWPGAIGGSWPRRERHAWMPAVMGCSETRRRRCGRARPACTALELGDEAIVDVARLHPRRPGDAQRTPDGQPHRASRLHLPGTPRGELTPTSGARSGRLAARLARQRGPSAASPWRWAASATRPTTTASLVTAHDEEPVEAAGVPALRAVGRRRDLAGPHAPRPQRRPGPERADDRHRRRGRARAGHPAGVAQLRDVPRRAGAGRAAGRRSGPAAWRGCWSSLSRWFQIESLYRFNAKFRPAWEPRFLVFPHTSDLPRIGLATLHAESLLTLALPRPRFIRRTWRAEPTSVPIADHSL